MIEGFLLIRGLNDVGSTSVKTEISRFTISHNRHQNTEGNVRAGAVLALGQFSETVTKTYAPYPNEMFGFISAVSTVVGQAVVFASVQLC